MLVFLFLHAAGVALIFLSPRLTSSTDYKWLCSSTVGCSMHVGPNMTHFDRMVPFCKKKNWAHLANVLDKKESSMAFLCSGNMRCCNRCTIPLTSDRSQKSTIVVVTRDDLLDIFHICKLIMLVGLVLELMLGIIVTSSRKVEKATVTNFEEKQRLVVNMDINMDVRLKGKLSQLRTVRRLSGLGSIVALVAEMCSIITAVMVPAIDYMRNLSCFYYVILYFVATLTAYTCIGLSIQRYITFCKDTGKTKPLRCVETCFWKIILSIMRPVLWLMLIGGSIAGSIYCSFLDNY